MRSMTPVALVALVTIPALAQPIDVYRSSNSLSRRADSTTQCHGPTCNKGAPTTGTLTDVQRPVQAVEPQPPSAVPPPPTPPPPPPTQSSTTPDPAGPPASSLPPTKPSITPGPVDPPANKTVPPEPESKTGPLPKEVPGKGSARVGKNIRKEEAVLIDWAGDRLFELFFGLHIGKVRSVQSLFDEPTPPCGATVHFPCSA